MHNYEELYIFSGNLEGTVTLPSFIAIKKVKAKQKLTTPNQTSSRVRQFIN